RWQPGHLGGALHFDGVYSFVSVPHDDALEPDALTISLWASIDRHTRLQILVIKLSGDDANGYFLALESTSSDSSHGFWLVARAGLGSRADSISTVSTDTWTHIAATFGGDRADLYINGHREATTLGAAKGKSPVPAFLGIEDGSDIPSSGNDINPFMG